MVDKKQRFLHIIIDYFLISLLATGFSFVAVWILLDLIKNDQLALESVNFDSRLFIPPVSVLYYFAMESSIGKTVGKYLTKTKVVALDGSQASVFAILIRSLVRAFFPLYAISFFWSSKGLHDLLSNTEVIKTKDQTSQS